MSQYFLVTESRKGHFSVVGDYTGYGIYSKDTEIYPCSGTTNIQYHIVQLIGGVRSTSVVRSVDYETERY